MSAAIILVAASTGLIVPSASADQLSNLRAQAEAIASKIQNLQYQDAAVGEQLDAATLAQQAAATKVSQAAAQVSAANANANKAKSSLQTEAVDAYTQGGTNVLATDDQGLASANDSLLRAEYEESLATDQSDAMDQYHLASVQAQTAKASLSAAQAAASAQANKLAQAHSSIQANSAQLQAVYQQDQGQIAQVVAQIQAQQAAAAAAAAQQAAAARAAAQQQQAAATAAAATSHSAAVTASGSGGGGSSSGGGGSSGSSSISSGFSFTNPAPPPGVGAAGAVAAALTRVGDPYVWGAAGPSTFDCSGLVMWAYDQVGISLPHYSGDQFSDGTQISMSELEPGDLVFPSDPGEHVAMYIGGGNIVQAPYTGADVQVVPLSSFFVLAVRIS